ncbi:MAG: TIGR04282 family arsenosugar biosynthesis glycosyltransferase [Verrucomicrobiales bacterium]
MSCEVGGEARRKRERVVVFTRYPELGRVKSRLAATLGPERACEIHDQLARHAVAEARGWGGELQIRVTGGEPEQWDRWLGPAVWLDQGGGDLGERLARAVDAAFGDGCEKLVLMGTDCPGLDRRVLARSFEVLAEKDVVFGPAEDGGYYLVGLNRRIEGLFDGVDWGTDRVLAQSLAKAPDAGLLARLSDVDVEDDLKKTGWC